MDIIHCRWDPPRPLPSILWTQPNRAVKGLSGAETKGFLWGQLQAMCHQFPRCLLHQGQGWPNQAGETTAPRAKVLASGHVNNQSRVAGILISRKSLRELMTLAVVFVDNATSPIAAGGGVGQQQQQLIYSLWYFSSSSDRLISAKSKRTSVRPGTRTCRPRQSSL